MGRRGYGREARWWRNPAGSTDAPGGGTRDPRNARQDRDVLRAGFKGRATARSITGINDGHRPVNGSSQTAAVQAAAEFTSAGISREPFARVAFLAVPVTSGLALGVHALVSKNEPPVESRSYTIFLSIVLGLSLAAAVVQMFWPGLRRWMSHMCPILAGALVLLSAWEIITAGLRWLPMPYFPSPAGVLQSLINDRGMILDSTWHSLQLLLGGYALGVLVGRDYRRLHRLV